MYKNHRCDSTPTLKCKAHKNEQLKMQKKNQSN